MSTMTWDVQPAFELRSGGRSAQSGARVAGARSPAARTGASAARSVGSTSDLRLTRRGRVVVTLASLGVATAVALTAQTATADSPREALPVETYTVAQGETLWQIAGEVAAPGQDLRDVVADLIDLNGLQGGALQAGQEILLPVDDH